MAASQPEVAPARALEEQGPEVMFPGAAVTKYYITAWLKRAEIGSRTVLEAKSLRSRCWHGRAASV